MTGIARIPRRRGSLCGILLVLLGAWGALIPFVGPYFHYAYSPDRAWAYSSGRLYLSILPGIAALLGGLLVLATRSRPVGVLGGFIAAAGGAWLVVGYPVILEITKKTTINPGVPTGAGTSPAVIGIPAIRVFAEELGFFTGLGIVVVFIAAIAIGRFSMLAARDVPAPQPADDDSYLAGPQASRQFPAFRPDGPSAATADAATTTTVRVPAARDDASEKQEPPPARTTRFPAAREQAGADQEPLPVRTSQVPAGQKQEPVGQEALAERTAQIPAAQQYPPST
jgi:hypothetical protein